MFGIYFGGRGYYLAFSLCHELDAVLHYDWQDGYFEYIQPCVLVKLRPVSHSFFRYCDGYL